MDTRLERLRYALESAVEGMSSEQLRWHPEGKWCAAEILEHLYLTYTGTIKGFQKVLESGRPLATRASLKQRWATFVVVGLNYLPTGRRSPAMAMPKGLLQANVRDEVGEKIVGMDAVIAECEARLGRHVQLLNHLFLGPLTGEQWRKFHWVHGLHHQKQILRLRQGMPQTG